MTDLLDRLRNLVQEDVGQRGLRHDPQRNLVSETVGDFRAACLSLAVQPAPRLAIVTGFFIPGAEPAAETDGPLGAVFLARALLPLGMRVAIASDASCVAALNAGLAACGCAASVPVVTLPAPPAAHALGPPAYNRLLRDTLDPTHLLAIERVGPNGAGRCHTMRGRDITEFTSPAHWLFDAAQRDGITTIGIGDGGNEIGMGKLDAAVIRDNIPRGELIACRVPVDHLIVAGVSNWGAYALAAGVYHLRGVAAVAALFDPEGERRILEVMVKQGPLVDGVLGKPSVTVDGLVWERYSSVLTELGAPY